MRRRADRGSEGLPRVMEGKAALLECLAAFEVLAKENPRRLADQSLGLLAQGLRVLLCRDCLGGMNQRALGKYYGVDARTIQRWAHRYTDFPRGRHDGNKYICYDTMEVMDFRKNHKELFER